MKTRKGTNARAWFYGTSFHANAFSREADAALKKSFELDDAAKPGDTYIDPVWGEVSIPAEDSGNSTE